ncbi:hypothetical protein MTBPR1_220003 [Candidatus Terasakiella magnetica]|uniref:Helicase/UvrB N-terminal domain-containing protein n=1 Tax=Candidatus Terasakiella magnetica TaxID=1867952 RepID=A0A1C3RH32_9PROT|nr:hypothetical protein [Candidatus Terasakiella magnetica]SCA56570.1 hypothetical protein MTBPR1_220003 [Candidatus Terasakiella magnetica]
MYEIKIVDALAGSGKTYQAIRWAAKKAHYNRENTVIVFKSKALIEEAWNSLKDAQSSLKSKVPALRIDQDHLGNNQDGTPNKSVKSAIMGYLDNIDTKSGISYS